MTGRYSPLSPDSDGVRPHRQQGQAFSLATAFASLPDVSLAALASLLVYALAHQAAFMSPLVINDDLRQQLFWMQRWLDPALYPPDLLNAYSRAYVPWGVQLLYWLGSFAANPLEFSKVVTGALFVGQCLLLMGLGRLLGGRPLAWGALCAGWLLPFFLDNISGGLSRAFASPLLAAMALAWLTRNTRLLGATLLAQALFIPYIFLPCALAVTSERAYGFLRGRPGLWLNTRIQGLFFAACALLVLAFSAWYSFLGFGPLVSLAETAGRPEFGPQGRLELAPLPNPFLDFVYFPFEGVGLFKELGLAAGIASLALLAVPVARGARRVSWVQLRSAVSPLGWLAGAFVVFYLAARILAFTLFVPDRYVQYPVNLLYALLLAACCVAAWQGSGRSRCATLPARGLSGPAWGHTPAQRRPLRPALRGLGLRRGGSRHSKKRHAGRAS